MRQAYRAHVRMENNNDKLEATITLRICLKTKMKKKKKKKNALSTQNTCLFTCMHNIYPRQMHSIANWICFFFFSVCKCPVLVHFRIITMIDATYMNEWMKMVAIYFNEWGDHFCKQRWRYGFRLFFLFFSCSFLHSRDHNFCRKRWRRSSFHYSIPCETHKMNVVNKNTEFSWFSCPLCVSFILLFFLYIIHLHHIWN